ncbi:MAG: capsular polysaccharide biosynthesis protein [uncultured bacterium]|uniref:Capsular polysaccharide biosynthesis protein n=3 Tax=Candidatus Daviesiibacteriota TaxID=1752718 RepID=A0A0G0HE29_9BACT|nr:MAG: capsular polysaccharide biosynthesis protein [uncultured bacterium]KKQ10369.1 MAG: Capsular polysaccharide biosynthesis protein [Candidatus Daviesbacteria bacterium GW2011_GWB1_36_5]KKQ15512.1 MAG: Capsular polysaccharide biosynthesis protein [Candidatus Daviesbacteria bacterium GW2011_GWA1_36_8]OGE17803.1 MAG: hypothetical protein A2858_03600 [Candidatus Daviesbacteria bacterium RIFCSPHIGHO2_01_FULL_36_37]
MKKKIVLFKKIISNPLFSGSFLMIVGSNFANAINYIYHTLMGRILGPSSYSELAAILSIINLVGIIMVSLGLVVTKFISSAKNEEEIKALIGWFNIKIFYLSLFILLLFLISASFISTFLNLHSNLPVIIMSFVIFITFPTFLLRASLQGLLKFNKLVSTLVLEHFLKLVVGLTLVVLGLSVSGAIFGILISVICAWILSRFFLGKYYSGETRFNLGKTKPIVFYALPVFIQSLSIASLNSTDLVLVKHFFNPHDAGLYAALSTLGKIIFFASGPIVAVMFPMVSQKFSKKEPFINLFSYGLALTLLISFCILWFYYLFPDLAIRVLYGSAYLEASSLVIWFGLYMAIFTLTYFLTNFFLSIGKLKVVIFPLFTALIQIFGIWLFHESLLEVIKVSLAAVFVLLISLLIYFMLEVKGISFNPNAKI